MAVTPQRMSLAEFLQLPEVKPARELRQGMVSQKMPPSGPHSSIQGWLATRFELFVTPAELGRAFPEMRLLLGEDTYVPDLVVYRWERIPSDEVGNLPTYFSTPPDLVVEIVSPGQTLTSQLERCRDLLGHGVRVTVLVHPERQVVYVVRASGEIGPLRAGAEIDLADVLPGCSLSIAELFARIKARPTQSDAQG
jgi:Uma2 family endonuclease